MIRQAHEQTIVATTGQPITGRQRLVPPIAATVFRPDRSAGATKILAADWDVCWLDGRSIASADDWLGLIDEGCLAAVEGSFALAWIDPEGVLHLARDGVGGRSLFYAETEAGIAFASSIKSLLGLLSKRPGINLPAVATYLAYAYLPGRETLAEGIFELLPGEHATFSDKGLHREQFWALPSGPLSTATEAELARELRSLLNDAVQRCLPAAGEPVGAFLSGGLDSSLIVALAAKLRNEPIKTFSVSFGAGHANELPFSSAVAAHCDTDHRIVELSPAVVLHHLDDTIAMLSDPIGDPLTVPNALLFREAANHVGVILNGEGGDPCFGGPKNLPMVLAELYGGDSVFAREASYLRAHLKCYDNLGEMLSPMMKDALTAAPLEAQLTPRLNDPRWPDFVARMQALNISIKGAHHILPKVDALSAGAGVVPRAPLFDRRVVELSLRIPPQMKLKGSIEKYLLKEAVRDLLPPAIIDRPKSGMLVPVEAWFRGPLLPAARERILDGLTPFKLFERDYLERLLAGKLGGLRPRHGAKIWLLITLEAWLRRVLNR